MCTSVFVPWAKWAAFSTNSWKSPRHCGYVCAMSKAPHVYGPAKDVSGMRGFFWDANKPSKYEIYTYIYMYIRII